MKNVGQVVTYHAPEQDGVCGKAQGSLEAVVGAQTEQKALEARLVPNRSKRKPSVWIHENKTYLSGTHICNRGSMADRKIRKVEVTVASVEHMEEGC